MSVTKTPAKNWNKNKCDAIVQIPAVMNNGISYLLHRFKHKEWSGPAWFSFTKDEYGFPKTIKLRYFLPLDLGGSGDTEWDDDKLAPHLEEMLKDPKMAKNMVQWHRGNIHSHHTMSAFVSGVDEATIIENAPSTLKDFYFSLIVSSTSQYDFGFSYTDQFGYNHWFRADAVLVGDNDNVEELIFSQAAVIEKEAEAKPKYSNSSYNPKKYEYKYNSSKKVGQNPTEKAKTATKTPVGFGANQKKPLTGGNESGRSIIPQQLEDDDISHQSSLFPYLGYDHPLLEGEDEFTATALQIFLAYKHGLMQEEVANEELVYENTTIAEMEANERAFFAQS